MNGYCRVELHDYDGSVVGKPIYVGNPDADHCEALTRATNILYRLTKARAMRRNVNYELIDLYLALLDAYMPALRGTRSDPPALPAPRP